MDPAAAAQGDPAAMGGDPAAMGGDPAAMGGAPPAGGGDPMAALAPMIQQMVQQAMAQQGSGAGGTGGAGGEMIKPKIDPNVALMRIEKMLARIGDAMGITMPMAEMVATPEDLTQMAAAQQQPAASPQGGAIPPVQPVGPIKAAEWEQGVAFTPPKSMQQVNSSSLSSLADRAKATLMRQNARQGA